jgi:hypothetical protein
MNCIRTLARKAANTLIPLIHHVGEPTKRVATEAGLVIAHRLSGSSDAIVDRFAYASATTAIGPRSSHCS